jgi:hypothetical protein
MEHNSTSAVIILWPGGFTRRTDSTTIPITQQSVFPRPKAPSYILHHKVQLPNIGKQRRSKRRTVDRVRNTRTAK